MLAIGDLCQIQIPVRYRYRTLPYAPLSKGRSTVTNFVEKRVCSPHDRLAKTGIWDNTCEQNRDLMHNHSHNRQLWKKKKKSSSWLFCLPFSLFSFLFFSFFSSGQGYTGRYSKSFGK